MNFLIAFCVASLVFLPIMFGSLAYETHKENKRKRKKQLEVLEWFGR